MCAFLTALLTAMGGIQAQNPVWLFPDYSGGGPSYGVSYNLLTDQQNALYALSGLTTGLHNQNGMINPEGKLGFYVLGGMVYSRETNSNNFQYIGNISIPGSDVNIPAAGHAEIAIAPDPADCNRFYVFTAGIYNGRYIPGFAIIQRTPSSSNEYELVTDPNTFNNATSLYDFIGDPNQPPQGNRNPCYFAVTPEKKGYRYVYYTNAEYIFKFRLGSPNGLEFISSVNVGGNYSNNAIRGEMEVIPKSDGTYTLAFPIDVSLNSLNDYLLLMDLNGSGDFLPTTKRLISVNNTTTGQVTGRVFVHGIEFDASGRYLYITVQQQNQPWTLEPLYYIDLQQTNPVLTEIPVPTGSGNLRFSQIEYHKKGKNESLYFSDGTFLYAYTKPSNPGTGVWTTIPMTYPSSNIFSTNVDEGRSFTLPDQIDGMDYSGFYTQTETCCIDSKMYNAWEYSVTGTEVWNGISNPFGVTDIYIGEKINIPAGSSLTLKNVTIHFAPDAEFNVFSNNGSGTGGRLVLDNAVLTVDESCTQSKMWKGVRLFGRPDKPQNFFASDEQPWMKMENGSRIEHARIGVALGTNDNNGGGVLQANGSVFLNNHRDVDIRPFQNSSQVSQNSRNAFINTTFKTSGLLKEPPTQQIIHVVLQRVRGVSFKGCTFVNETLADYPVLFSRGKGIHSNESVFSVTPYCTGTAPIGTPCPSIPCTFKNMETGITAASFSYGHASVTGALFENLVTGFYGSGNCNPRLLENIFYILPDQTYSSSGVYLTGTPSFVIQENEFEEFGNTGSTSGNTYGVVIDNSGEFVNYVYRNTFKNLKVGGQSQGINSTAVNGPNPPIDPILDPPSSEGGLRWLCNTFTGNIYDADLAVTSGRIFYNQGYNTNAWDADYHKNMAGNLFSSSSYTPDNNYFLDPSASALSYVCHNPTSSYPTYPTLHTTPGVGIHVGMDPYDPAKACKSKINPLVSMNPIDLFAQKEDLTDELGDYLEMVDGGSTINRLNQIQFELPNDLLSLLSGDAPYSSDKVLWAYLSTDAIDEDKIELLAANSPLSARIYQKAIDVLGEETVEEHLEGLQGGLSEYLALEAKIVNLKQDIEDINAQMTEIYMEEGSGLSTLKDIYANNHDLSAVLRRIDLSIAMYDEAEALNELNNFSNTDEGIEAYAFFETAIPFLTSLNREQYLQEHPDFLGIMEGYISFGSLISKRAAHIFNFYTTGELYHYIEPIIRTNNQQSRSTATKMEMISSEIYAYPNPTNGKVLLRAPKEITAVNVMDITGRIILFQQIEPDNTLDLTSLPPGTYYLNTSLEDGKQVVISIIKK